MNEPVDLIARYLAGTDEAEVSTLRSNLVGHGESIIVPVLRGVPDAMKDTPEQPAALNPMDNARSLVESFGQQAHQALVSGLADRSSAVRALSALFLGYKRVRTAASVSVLKSCYDSDPDALVKMTAAAALIANDDTDEEAYQKLMAVLVNWANRVAPGWQSLADNAQWAVAELVVGMVGRALKDDSSSTPAPAPDVRASASDGGASSAPRSDALCNGCATPMPDGARYCPSCGKPQASAAAHGYVEICDIELVPPHTQGLFWSKFTLRAVATSEKGRRLVAELSDNISGSLERDARFLRLKERIVQSVVAQGFEPSGSIVHPLYSVTLPQFRRLVRS